jgi:hypothetical protein
MLLILMALFTILTGELIWMIRISNRISRKLTRLNKALSERE